MTLIKESDIDNVLSKLIGFRPSLNFTADKFDDGVVHYWDLKTIDNKTDIYYNDTHIGQHTGNFPVTNPEISMIE